jgi:hypothetical protein
MSLTNNAKPLPEIFISKEVVNERVKNYVNNKLPKLNETLSGSSDTQSGWYSLEQFEELMREMYHLNADGLRIYFGAYGDNDPLYPNQLTFMFVPTYLNAETGNTTDIMIEDLPDFPIRAALPDSKKNYDSASLCPPCPPNNTLSYPF